MYVVESPELIVTVQRPTKILTFPIIAAKFVKTTCGTRKETNDILNVNVNSEEWGWGVSVLFYRAVRLALAPEAGLNDSLDDP